MIVYKEKTKHAEAVERLQNQLKGLKAAVSLAPNRSSNTMRDGSYKNAIGSIDLSSFNAVISIDKTLMTIEIEPKATMQTLVDACLAEGLMPLVVPEFTSITVGGAIMGAALESSSHSQGQFADTALEYEVLLGDGTKLTLSPKEHADLFYGLSGSYGSLCILTLVKLQLKLAKPFVKLTFTPFNDRLNLLAHLKEPSDSDFVEGILFGKDFGVVIRGHLTDVSESGQIISQSKWFDRFFYHQVLRRIKKGQNESTMRLRDYLFRLDRGAFWMGRFLLSPALLLQAIFKYKLNSMPEKIKENTNQFPLEKELNFFFRFLFGWIFKSASIYRLWHAVPLSIKEQLFFVQDLYVPEEKIEEALSFLEMKTGIYPLWLCPIQGTATAQFLSPHYGKKRFINVGLYGLPRGQVKPLTVEIEEKILEWGGRKMLYALTYYSKEKFEKYYAMDKLELLRKTYMANGLFLPLYNKVRDVL